VQILNRRGEVVRTVRRSKESAERLAKFKRTYRIPSQVAETRPITKVVEKPKTSLEELEEEEAKANAEKVNVIDTIKGIKDVAELEQYLNHPMKSVKTAAEKRFKELTK